MPDTNQLIGTYQSVGSRLTVSTEGNGLMIDLAPVEAPEGTPPMRGELLPITSERFVLHAPALGDDLPVTFMEPNGDGAFQYLHMGARLHRRVPTM